MCRRKKKQCVQCKKSGMINAGRGLQMYCNEESNAMRFILVNLINARVFNTVQTNPRINETCNVFLGA